MSVKRKDLVKYLEENGFYLLREGGNHSIYTNDLKTIPVKRHRTIDRIIAVPIQIRYNIISHLCRGTAVPCPYGCTSRKREPLYCK